MGHLVRAMYSGQNQSVFRLNSVKFCCCDFPAKISMDSNASCLISFGSGSSSSEVVDFYPTLRLVYVIADV
jgi:hypothetical protein